MTETKPKAMPEVQRYWHCVDLTKDSEGDYVLYDDYESLQTKCAELEAENKEIGEVAAGMMCGYCWQSMEADDNPRYCELVSKIASLEAELANAKDEIESLYIEKAGEDI